MNPRTEPLLTVGGVTAAATAVIGLVVAFWPGLLSDTQQTAILALVAVAAPLIVGIVARKHVTPNAAVAERVNEHGTVIAGAANDLVAEGQPVRALGEPAPAPMVKTVNATDRTVDLTAPAREMTFDEYDLERARQRAASPDLPDQFA